MKIRLPKFNLLRMFGIVIIIPTVMVFLTIVTMHHDSREYKVTHEVYFELESEGKPLGMIVIGLFGDTVPRTVKNFITFATKGYAGYKYEGTHFHRVIKKFMIQGGDVVTGDGKGSISIYGQGFPDENFEIHHSGPGFISMANNGKDTNGCQFFITTIATPWLDGHHVVFGKVIKGQTLVHQIEHKATDWNDRPIKAIEIIKSGRRLVDTPYYITDDPYNLKDWVKTISVPLGLSFAIMYVFHYFIQRLDKSILDDDGSMDDEQTAQRKKKELQQATKKLLEEKEEENEKPEDKSISEEKANETDTAVRKRTAKVSQDMTG